MKIPVFVSCPTALNPAQDAARAVLMQFLDELNLEPRALGRSDYPSELPLREVLLIARHCAGVTDVFIHKMPDADVSAWERASLKDVFLKWHGRVSTRYYAM